jgi:hypothetical protein
MIGALLQRVLVALGRAAASVFAEELEHEARETPVPPTHPEPWTYRNVADVARQRDAATAHKVCSACGALSHESQPRCSTCGAAWPLGKS